VGLTDAGVEHLKGLDEAAMAQSGQYTLK